MTNIKACIFDLDGVIVDTAKYHYLAWKRLANELGFDFTEKDNEKLKGVSRMESLEILLNLGNIKVDEETKLKLAEKKNNWYRELISKMDESEILPRVKEFINELKNSNIKVAIGSSSKNTMTILNSIKMTDFFDAIIDGNKITKAKPDPEVFLLGAEALGVNPNECVVFEDAESGIKAAKNAGMYAVGIGSKEILKEADKVIPNTNSLTLDIINF
ncbi:beta-phosphoglucomutase [Caloranaerobacter azorensis DSM 13643]|uniref:Beta-phosphoglucomutase n=1 Tax=Caloranaerobacter azorensis DSM 13643 TaxID=1121264 RepID=A0A1M5UXH7_9FIRM|nr:beta-phosphoglucomutase [Caloranaerobacter azorensis]SHH67721.1 beta-phosphoglucomutase [Caloranaerobacter azorensis DSM 13643]